MTPEMLESIRKKAEAFPALSYRTAESHFGPFTVAKHGTIPFGGDHARFTLEEVEFLTEARGDILALLEENFALRAALAVQRNDEDWRAKYLLAQMEAGKLRKTLGEIHEELIEADCVSDCPPEWARCWVCRLRVKVGRELKEKK